MVDSRFTPLNYVCVYRSYRHFLTFWKYQQRETKLRVIWSYNFGKSIKAMDPCNPHPFQPLLSSARLFWQYLFYFPLLDIRKISSVWQSMGIFSSWKQTQFAYITSFVIIFKFYTTNIARHYSAKADGHAPAWDIHLDVIMPIVTLQLSRAYVNLQPTWLF